MQLQQVGSAVDAVATVGAAGDAIATASAQPGAATAADAATTASRRRIRCSSGGCGHNQEQQMQAPTKCNY